MEKNDTIYSTGAFLKPVECIINGKNQWRWVVIEFEDDTYFNGDTIDVYEYSDNFEGLIVS